jgi:peptide/nickel transport system substrate-binding protein
VLDRLGFRTTLRTYPVYQKFYEQAGRPSASIEGGIQGWETNFQRASDFFLNLLTCDSYQPAAQVNLNAAGFCSPRVDRAMERARELEPTDPGAASKLWARSDRAVVDEAPWIPLVNTAGLDLVSARVGNYQRSPQYGVLLDQLWVK